MRVVPRDYRINDFALTKLDVNSYSPPVRALTMLTTRYNRAPEILHGVIFLRLKLICMSYVGLLPQEGLRLSTQHE